MKKLFGLLIAFVSLFAFVLAANQPSVGSPITQQNVSSFRPIQSCVDGQTVYVTKHYYVGDSFYIFDNHWGDSNGYAYIYDTSSRVLVRDPYNVLDFDDVFRFKSNGKPTGVYDVKFVENTGNFLSGTLTSSLPNVNGGALVAQVVFNLNRQWFHIAGGSASYSMSYWPMPNGPQNTASFSNYYVGNYASGYECYNYVVHYCGDGDVDTANSIRNLPGGNHNSVANEQCDPNDPTHQGWGANGCSDTCQPIDAVVQAPTCTLNIVQTPNLSYNIQYNILGTFNNAILNITPPLVNFPTHTITNNAGTITNIVPTGYGTFTATMTVSNSAGSNVCQGTFYVPEPEKHVCGDGHIDSPNDNGVYEQCDNGPSFGNGCNNQCQLMTPSCTLMADSQYQLVGNPVTFTANKDIWAIYYALNLGDTIFGTPNIINTGDIVFPYQYMYTNMLSYNPILTVQNNHMPIATGVVRPTAVCDTDIQVVNGCDITVDPYIINLGDVAEVSWQIWPDFNIPAFMNVSPSLVGTWPHNIYYKTGKTYVGPNITNTGTYTFSIDAMTSNGYPFACTGHLYVGIEPLLGELDINKILLTTGDLIPGDFVDYRIELTNTGSGTFYDAYISDVMPTSLDLIYNNLVGVYPYDQSQWQDINGNWFFEYSGFDLTPGQTVYVNVRGQVRHSASANNTINCAFTSGDYDCVIYDLASDPYVLKSQMMSNNIINTTLTTGTINVNTGDYIKYRIDFANMGGEKTTGGVRVVDHMPLCINYVSANIYGVSNANFTNMQDINGRRVLEYNGFDLLAGQGGYMIVTGQVMDSSMCNPYTTYTNDSYVYFYNPMIVRQSSTTAIRANKSIVVVTKDSSPDIHLPGDDKLFVVQVQNVGPNPISNVVLEDIWPNITCISYVDWTGSAGFTKNPASLVWTHSATLVPGATLNLYISGSIANNASCVSPDYENIVNLRYTEMGVQYSDQANYHFAVDSTPVANISLIKTANKNVVSSGDDITYSIVYQNMGNTALSSYIITDYRPGMIEFISASPFPSNVVNVTSGSILTWNFYNPLLPGQTGQIVLQGKVK